MKNTFKFFMVISLFAVSCQKEFEKGMLPDKEVTAEIKLGIKTSKNGRSSYNIDHASITLQDAENTNDVTTYQSIQTANQTIGFSLPDCHTLKLIELNVYDSNNNLILIQDESSVGKTITVCHPEGGGPNPGNGDDPIDVDVTEPIRSLYFDWENATYVSDNNTFPRLPWISGASTGIAREIALDNKHEDGWELMHNSFTLESGNDEPRKKYLLFYNKFTGMLRMWYWYEGSNSTSQIKYSIQHVAASSMLNFNDDFAHAMDIRQPYYSEYVTGGKSIPSGQGFASNSWYMFEYEIAYDNNVAALAETQSDLFLGARGINISEIELSGTQNGEINGQVILNAPGSNLFNIDANINTGGSNSAPSSAVTTNDPEGWWAQAQSKIVAGIVSSMGNAGASLASSVLNLVTNPVGNYLNSLVHQGLESRGSVNLKMATHIKLNGTITQEVAVSSINLHIPASQNNSLEYLYNNPLGVFNLTTNPIVNYQQTYYHIGTSYDRYFQYFEIENNSINFEINPAIINDITIISKKTDLYFYKKYEGSTILNPYFTEFGEAHPNPASLVFKDTEGKFEYYRITQGFVPPAGTTSYGIMYDNIASQGYIDNLIVMPPDGRIVVKAILKIRINSTGRVVTFVKSYLPKDIVYKQTYGFEY